MPLTSAHPRVELARSRALSISHCPLDPTCQHRALPRPRPRLVTDSSAPPVSPSSSRVLQRQRLLRWSLSSPLVGVHDSEIRHRLVPHRAVHTYPHDTALSSCCVVPSSLLCRHCAHSSVPASHRHSPSPVAYKRAARSSFLARTTPLPLPSLSSPRRPSRAHAVPASWAGWNLRPCSPARASKLIGPESPQAH